mgnify:CR=1 FL=1
MTYEEKTNSQFGNTDCHLDGEQELWFDEVNSGLHHVDDKSCYIWNLADYIADSKILNPL